MSVALVKAYVVQNTVSVGASSTVNVTASCTAGDWVCVEVPA